MANNLYESFHYDRGYTWKWPGVVTITIESGDLMNGGVIRKLRFLHPEADAFAKWWHKSDDFSPEFEERWNALLADGAFVWDVMDEAYDKAKANAESFATDMVNTPQPAFVREYIDTLCA